MTRTRDVWTSPSQRRDFLTCETLWGFKNIARIQGMDREAPLRGSAFHAALERFYQGGKWPSCSYAIKEVINAATIKPDRKEFLKVQTTAMLWAYMKLYRDDLTKWDVLKVEWGYKVPLAPGLVDVGYIDLLVRDRKDRRIWIVDTKTRSDIDDDWVATLGMDSQLGRYLTVIRAEYPDDTVAGVIFNAVRTPALRPKSKPPEHLEAYGCRVQTTMVAERQDYFRRVDVLASVMDADRITNEAIVVARRIAEAKQPGYDPIRSDRACKGPFGACEFLPLCSAGIRPIEVLSRAEPPPGYRERTRRK